jgi:hypothetical protein
MAYTLTTAQKNTMLTTLVTAAGATSTIKIYGGTVPADANAANSGTLLVSLPCSATAGTVASGTLTYNAITTTNCSTGGTATFYRHYASDGTTTLSQGSVGVSGADLNLISTTLTATGPVSITSLTVSI